MNQEIVDYLNQNRYQNSKEALIHMLKGKFPEDQINEAADYVFNSPKGSNHKRMKQAAISSYSFKNKKEINSKNLLFVGIAIIFIAVVSALFLLTPSLPDISGPDNTASQNQNTGNTGFISSGSNESGNETPDENAVDKNDMIIFENIIGIYDRMVDGVVGIKEGRDMANESVCNGIKSAGVYNKCYLYVQIILGNHEACKNASQTFMSESQCYTSVAMFTKDESLCDKTTDENCIKSVRKARNEIEVCEELEEIERDFCYKWIAVNTNDISICEKINIEDIRIECEEILGNG